MTDDTPSTPTDSASTATKPRPKLGETLHTVTGDTFDRVTELFHEVDAADTAIAMLAKRGRIASTQAWDLIREDAGDTFDEDHSHRYNYETGAVTYNGRKPRSRDEARGFDFRSDVKKASDLAKTAKGASDLLRSVLANAPADPALAPLLDAAGSVLKAGEKIVADGEKPTDA